MEGDSLNRVNWPDFDWLEYRALEGTGYSSLIGATGEIVRLIPIRSPIARRKTDLVGYELTVGSQCEGKLMGFVPRTLRRFAEVIVRARYPQHFRGRPGDQPTAPASSSRINPNVSGFVKRSPSR